MAIKAGGGIVLRSTDVVNPNVNSLTLAPNPVTGAPTAIVQSAADGTKVFSSDPSGNVLTAGVITSQVGFSSPTGFKSLLPGGCYYGNASANTFYSTWGAVFPALLGLGNQMTTFVCKVTHSGSIVGWSLNQFGNVNGVNYLRIYKNGVIVATVTAGTGNNGASFCGTFAKGMYTFSVGDTLQVYVANSSSGTILCTTYLTVEFAA